MLTRYHCTADVLIDAIKKFSGRKILVVGDMMLDRFIWGSVSRISPEAPVPVVEIRRESTCLGGAANVAVNVRSLGGMPVPLGILGDDFEGERLRDEFRALGMPVGGLTVQKGRSTCVKTRIIAHHQQVCRTDREDRRALPRPVQDGMAALFRKHLPEADGVIVSDYAKGMITPALLRRILPLVHKAGKIVCVDPKQKSFTVYRPATMITPNLLEIEAAAGMAVGSRRDLVRAGKKILEATGIRYLLVTRGEQGMTLFEGDSRVTHIPTHAREVFDVTGAGDTVISTLALGLASGLKAIEAAVLANIAAGIVVGKLGTASVSPEELSERISETEKAG